MLIYVFPVRFQNSHFPSLSIFIGKTEIHIPAFLQCQPIGTCRTTGNKNNSIYRTILHFHFQRRILRFTFDSDRPHSPTIQGLKYVYITESKSVADYLRQLEQLGEREEDYHSVWHYAEGKTETVADIFCYPPQINGLTHEFTNFKQ